MSIRYATDAEIANWNTLIAANPGGGAILQGYEFIDQKTDAGWCPRFMVADTHAIAAIEKHIPLFGKVWYIPKGPSVASVDDLAALIEKLKPFAAKQGVFTIKIEPNLDHTTDLSTLGLTKTKVIQYDYSTVFIDLSPSIDTILAGLNQKGRHAINRAKRDGVTIKKVPLTDENLDTMYALFRETADDAHFVIRPKSYYKRFYERYGDNGGLFFAYYDGQVVAGAFAMVLGTKSMYKDGASIRKRTAYGASHLLQWEVIQWAKSRGSLEHDLAGIPPLDQLHNPDHPFYGMGRFKTSFNKQATQFVGAYEIPIRPLRSRFWTNFLEKVVRRVYFKVHGESWY